MRTYKKICKVSLNAKWMTEWYTNKKSESRRNVFVDYQINQIINKMLEKYIVCKINISRLASSMKIDVFCSRNLHILSKNQELINETISKIKSKIGEEVSIDIHQQQNPDCNAFHVAKSIAMIMEASNTTRLKKQFLLFASNAIREGAKGIYIAVKGRVNGATIARRESFYRGSVPKNTLSLDIDFAKVTSFTVSGACGVKVYINK